VCLNGLYDQRAFKYPRSIPDDILSSPRMFVILRLAVA
jgi:hypothetical protein